MGPLLPSGSAALGATFEAAWRGLSKAAAFCSDPAVSWRCFHTGSPFCSLPACCSFCPPSHRLFSPSGLRQPDGRPAPGAVLRGKSGGYDRVKTVPAAFSCGKPWSSLRKAKRCPTPAFKALGIPPAEVQVAAARLLQGVGTDSTVNHQLHFCPLLEEGAPRPLYQPPSSAGLRAPARGAEGRRESRAGPGRAALAASR